VSEPGHAFTEEFIHLEGWQWFGPAFVCERRCWGHLAAGIEVQGYSWEYA
jgi:hypothetical protein